MLQVTEYNSRSALLQWSPPERLTEAISLEGKSSEFEISEADLRYEVLLSDKGKDGKYKSIYSGISLSCRSVHTELLQFSFIWDVLIIIIII